MAIQPPVVIDWEHPLIQWLGDSLLAVWYSGILVFAKRPGTAAPMMHYTNQYGMESGHLFVQNDTATTQTLYDDGTDHDEFFLLTTLGCPNNYVDNAHGLTLRDSAAGELATTEVDFAVNGQRATFQMQASNFPIGGNAGVDPQPASEECWAVMNSISSANDRRVWFRECRTGGSRFNYGNNGAGTFNQWRSLEQDRDTTNPPPSHGLILLADKFYTNTDPGFSGNMYDLIGDDPYSILKTARPSMDNQATVTSSITLSYLRPDGTSVTGSWTTQAAGTDLHNSIDEETFSDADYIQSTTTPSADTCEVTLGNPPTGVDTTQPVTINWRYQKDGTATINLTVNLKEGANTRATQTASNISETVTAGTLSLSQAEIDSVTNWNNLSLEFVATEV